MSATFQDSVWNPSAIKSPIDAMPIPLPPGILFLSHPHPTYFFLVCVCVLIRKTSLSTLFYFQQDSILWGRVFSAKGAWGYQPIKCNRGWHCRVPRNARLSWKAEMGSQHSKDWGMLRHQPGWEKPDARWVIKILKKKYQPHQFKKFVLALRLFCDFVMTLASYLAYFGTPMVRIRQ